MHLDELIVPRKDLSHLKNYISETHDTYRRKYGILPITRPRRHVIFGTTDRMEFLSDEAGEYRRFNPLLLCEPTEADDKVYIDLDQFKLHRTDLFREAKTWLHAHPDDWWVLDTAEQAEHALEHQITDSWEPAVNAWLEGPPVSETGSGNDHITKGFTLADVFLGAFKKEPVHITKGDEMRMAKVLKTLRCRLRYHKTATPIGGTSKDRRSFRRWHAPALDATLLGL